MTETHEKLEKMLQDDPELKSNLEEHLKHQMEEGTDPFDASYIPDGLKHNLEGFLEYAREVVVNRAIPDYRDGLKPVQRIGLYVFNKDKKLSKGKVVKSSSIVGTILPLHPHGDASAYEAICRMTDVKGILNIPLIKGDGQFGNRFTKDAAGAMRYTSMSQVPYFKSDIVSTPQGVDYIMTEEEEDKFFENIPVSFPLVLANVSTGIAVGLSTNIPSFNISDITEMVKEYIETGKIETIPVPDFSTGGMIVKDNKALTRIARTGKGSLKLRATTTIQRREILVSELPYGVTVEKIKKDIELAQENGYLNDVMDWYEDTGLGVNEDGIDDYKFGFVITCRSARVAEECLLELYNKTSLQKHFHSNIIVIDNGSPKAMGVHNIIRNWVKWRKRVVSKQAKYNVSVFEQQLKRLDAFLRLVEDKELLNEVIKLIQSGKKQDALDMIVDKLDVEIDSANWAIERKLSQFSSVSNKYKNQYDELVIQNEYWNHVIKKPESYILEDMERIDNNSDFKKRRRTEITSVDYNFVKREEEAISNEEAYFVIDNGFIKKLASYPYIQSPTATVLEGKSSDVVICIDDAGHILRIYGEELPYNIISDRGTYIPLYCGFEDEPFIMWSEIAETDKKFNLIYKDGYVGHLDTTKYARENVNQRSRVQMIGIYYDTDLLEDIIPYQPDNYLVVRQETSRKNKIGVVKIGDIKIRSSKARTKVMNATDITDWGIFSKNELDSQFFPIDEFLLDSENKKMKDYEGVLPAHIN